MVQQKMEQKTNRMMEHLEFLEHEESEAIERKRQAQQRKCAVTVAIVCNRRDYCSRENATVDDLIADGSRS